MDSQKIDEYEITGALNPCVQTKPCVQNSSCVGVRKNDGAEIIHISQRKRACQDPVKRRLLKKTDMRNDELVMNVDEHLVNVVSMLTKDENMPEANSNEDNEMPKVTILDDFQEMMKESRTMTVVRRSEASEKHGRVKSRLVLKDYNRCQGRTQPEMF